MLAKGGGFDSLHGSGVSARLCGGVVCSRVHELEDARERVPTTAQFPHPQRGGFDSDNSRALTQIDQVG